MANLLSDDDVFGAPANGGLLSDDDVFNGSVQSVTQPSQVAEPGDYLRGLKQYGPQMQQMWGAGKAVLGKAIDSPSLIESGIGSMKEAEGKLQSIGSKPTDEITGVNSVGDFVDWAQHGLGQVTGNLAESALTAGAGALLGSFGAPGVGTAGGAATGLIGKSIVKGALKEQAEKIARDYGVDSANSFVAKNVARTVGTNAGLAGGALYHGVGETGSRAFEEAGYDPSKVDLSQVLPASAAHAGAEYFGDKILLGGLLGENAYRAAGNGVMPFAKTVLGNAAQVAGKEIPVEMFQTGAERYAAGLPLANEEAGKEYLNTAAQTALFGVAGVPGGVRSYLNKETSPSAQQAQPQTEATPAEQDQSINEMSPLVDQFNGLSQTPALDYNGQPSVITVPTQEGGQTTIDRNAGPLSAAVVDTGVSDMLNTGMPLRSYPNRADAQAALDARDDADRMTIAPHPRASGRFAVVPKDRLTLQAIDQAAARNQQLSEEEGNASQVDATGNQGQRDNGTRGAGAASANTGIGSGGGQPAGASVGRGGTDLSLGSGNTGVGDVNATQTQQMAAQTVATPAAQTGSQQTATPESNQEKLIQRGIEAQQKKLDEINLRREPLVSEYNGLVRQYKTADDAKKAELRPVMDVLGKQIDDIGREAFPVMATVQKLQSQINEIKIRSENNQKFGAMPIGTRVGIAGHESNEGVYFEKTGDDEWTRFGIGSQNITVKNADLDSGSRVIKSVAPQANQVTQPSQQQQSADRRAVNPSSDSALVAIAKLGGINTQELLSNGFDEKDISVLTKGRVIGKNATKSGGKLPKNAGQLGKGTMRARQVGFNLPIHRSNGLSFDGMREMLQQHGYLPEGASKNDMIELFRRSLTENIHTPQATEQMAIEAAEARAAEMQAEEEANEASGYNDLETNREQQAADQLVEELFGEDAAAFSRGLRASGVYTEDEIYAEVEKQFNQRAVNQADSETSPQGRDRGGFEESRTDEEVFGGTETEDPFGVGATESADPFGLEGQTNEQAAADFAQQQAPEAISKEQIDREVSGFGLTQQSQPKPQGVQSGLFTADGRAAVDADQSKQSRQRGRTPEQANADRAQRKANLEREQEPESNDAKVVNQAVKSNDAQIHAANDLPNSNEVGDRQVSRQQARFIEKVASMFGKRVVFFSSESAEQPDGFWNRGKTIYINVNSSVTQLRVLGHEMTHAMKKFAPEAYKNMLRAVSHLISNAELRAQYRNYYGKSEEAMSNAEIDAALKDKATRDDIVEEWISDLAGNRFAESSFWSDVFTQIESQHGAQAAKTIIGKLRLALVNALNKIMSAIKGNKFAVDNRMAEHLDDIRKAIATGFAEYAKASQQGFPNQTPDNGAIKFSPSNGTLLNDKLLSDQKEKAEAYFEATGFRPYVPEKVEIRAEIDQSKFSPRRNGNNGQDPATGLWLNKNGTVNLYLHTTNDAVLEIHRSKKIVGDASGRIILTDESQAFRVLKPGQEKSGLGGVVMVQVNPQLLHHLSDNEDGTKTFFIPTHEGKSFKARMQMWSMFKSRKDPISYDATIDSVQSGIAKAMSDWKNADVKGRREMLRNAKKVLATEHNISTLMTENGKLESTRDGEFGLKSADGRGVDSLGLGLAAAQAISPKWKTTCPQSASCEAVCLGDTAGGNMQYGGVASADSGFDERSGFRSGPRLSQYLKTEALIVHPYEFAIKMQSEIDSLVAWDKKQNRPDRINKKTGQVTKYSPNGYESAIRLNVTSDLPPKVWKSLMEANQNIKFYDYTKLGGDPIAENHHLTYSSTGASQIVNGEVIANEHSNWERMRDRLDRGYNVAMAFSHTNHLPEFLYDEETGKTYRVWNGDNYDARYRDPKQDDGVGMIIGLKKKDATMRDADAAAKSNGFFLNYEPSVTGKGTDVTVKGDTVTMPDQRQFAEAIAARKSDAKTKRNAFKGIAVKTENPIGSQGGAPKAVSTSADTSSGVNSNIAENGQKFSTSRQDLESIFAGLDSRGLARKRAEDKLDGIREIARVRYVQDSFLDILAELEDSGKVLINCD